MLKDSYLNDEVKRISESPAVKGEEQVMLNCCRDPAHHLTMNNGTHSQSSQKSSTAVLTISQARNAAHQLMVKRQHT